MSPRFRLIFLIALAALVLISISLHSDPANRSSFSRRMMLEVVGGVQEALGSVSRGLENIWTSYFYLVDLQEENRDLIKKMDKLKGRIAVLNEQKMANLRLVKLLHFAAERDFPYLGARVVAWDPSPWFKTITIDRGASDGLRIGMPVINDLGVVGRVVEVSPHYAKVLLVIDYTSSIPAMIQKNRSRGVLTGRSETLLQLKYVEKIEDLRVGDLIVTSGMGGQFPKGLPLGKIRSSKKPGHEMHMVLEVEPLVDFDRLEEVLVIFTTPQPFMGALPAGREALA